MTNTSETGAVQIFDNPDFGKIRVIMIDNEPWFVGKDVAEVLGYKDQDQAIRKNCKYTKTYPVQTTGQVRYLKIIPESDVYRLIIKSKLPAAEKFETWVMEEVLVSIRKTGSYSSQNALFSAYPQLPKNYYEALTELVRVEGERMQLEEENKIMAPKAEKYDELIAANGTYTVSETAKLLGTGRNRLFEFLRLNGILRKNNEPYQYYIDVGYIEVKTYKLNNLNRVKTQVYITPKGLDFIKNLFDKYAGKMLMFDAGANENIVP